MIWKFFILGLFILVFSTNIYAQDSFVNRDSRVDSLILYHQEINKLDSLIPGYRVQIFFESGNYSKDLAITTAENFSEKYPNVRYYLSFSEPYYRIRVGDFRTFIEAKGFLAKIISEYPSAFEVKDMIYFPILSE